MNLLNSLGSRFRASDPQHLAIFRGMLTVALFMLLGKLMSAAKEMAVAYRYGLAAEVDAYQFLYNLVSWPVGIWSSVLTAVLVPLAVRLHASDKQGTRRFRAELFGFALVLGVALAMLVWLGVRVMLAFGMGGLPVSSARLVDAALPGLVLLLPLGLLIALQSAWMLAAGRHVNTLLDSVPTIFIAGAVLVFAAGGIAPLVWGTVVGAAFHLLALWAPAVRRHEFEKPMLTRVSPQWPWFWQGFGIMLAGQALMSFTVIIDQFYAAGMGTGSVATLGYANRVLSLILSLAAIAVARATLPIFSQAGVGDTGKVQRIAMHWARLMFLVGIAASAVAYMIASEAIRLLFERGQFSAGDTLVVAEVLRYGLAQLPFYFSSMVLVSYALSQRKYGLIFWSGVIGCIAKVVGNLVFVPRMGINGIAFSTVFVYALNAAFFCVLLRRSQ